MTNLAIPRVSILVPTYNYAAYIGDALDSILAQDFADFEVIISDDASTDNTESIVHNYLARDSRIRFFRQEKNIGMVQNWNWCLEHARGELIKFLFADDDFVSSSSLSLFVGMMASSNVVIAASARRLIDGQSRQIGLWDEIKNSGIHSGSVVARACLVGNRNMIGEPTAVMFRKDAMLRGFDTEFRQIVDLELWISLCLKGQFSYTSTALCSFRVHAGQQSAKNSRDQIVRSENAKLFFIYFDEILHRSTSLQERLECWFMFFFHLNKLKKIKDSSEDEQDLLSAMQKKPAKYMVPFYWFNYRIWRLAKNWKRTVVRLIKNPADKNSIPEGIW